MAMTYNPPFPQTPKKAYAEVTGTTTDRTGATTTNMVTLVTAGSNGTKVTEITVKIEGISVASTLLIFITNTSGSSPKLYDEIIISAITASSTVASFKGSNTYSDLELASGQLIQVGVTALSANAMCWAQQGDF